MSSAPTDAPGTPWTGLARAERFYEDGEIGDLVARAARYAAAGVPVHLSGAAGLGKTSVALRVAERLGRPVAFMAGNAFLTSRDFIGASVGQSTNAVVDRYVQSVRRTESQTRPEWRDAILARAMERGYTLVYDEFTRASPEANSTLLSVLEEGVLVSTDQANERVYLSAHPDFRIVLTSNPEDYVGVCQAPDAVLDRVVTLRLSAPTQATLARIVALRSGIDLQAASRIAALVRAVAEHGPKGHPPSMRSAILIARIAAADIRAGRMTDALLAEIAGDVLDARGGDRGELDRLIATARAA